MAMLGPGCCAAEEPGGFLDVQTSLPPCVFTTMWHVTTAALSLLDENHSRLIHEGSSGAFSLPCSLRTLPSSVMATLSSKRSPVRKPRIFSACSRSEACFSLSCWAASASLCLASRLPGSMFSTARKSRCASASLSWPMSATPRRYNALVFLGLRAKISVVVSITRVHSLRRKSHSAMLFFSPCHVSSAFSMCRQPFSSNSSAPEYKHFALK
mmetsp:Transcript_101166/g.291301  ORF Transcript_101166/g.291301 Transcript_101166/m.291301 type:complete len:212 (-) Transcript_101166:182-817(-)